MSRDVQFIEEEAWDGSIEKTVNVKNCLSHNDDEELAETHPQTAAPTTEQQVTPLRRNESASPSTPQGGNSSASTSTCTSNERGKKFRNLSDIYDEGMNSLFALYCHVDDPVHFEDAINDKKWIEAMDEEMNAIERNKTWDLVELSKGKEVILPMNGRKELKSLEDMFKEYGVRYVALAKMTEIGFTANTLVNMTEEEIEDLMKTLVELYHMDLLIGERYGIKSAIRAEKKRLQDSLQTQSLEILSEAERKRILHDDQNTFAAVMASEGTSKELRANDPLIFPESISADHAPMNIARCKDSTLILQNSNQA